MIDSFDEAAFFRALDEAKRRREESMKLPVNGKFHILLEGFVCEDDHIEIGPELAIVRISKDERELFLDRFKSLSTEFLDRPENQFFAIYNFETTRGDVVRFKSPSELIQRVSIFLSSCGKGFVNTNKAQVFYYFDNAGYRSGGVTTGPLRTIFPEESRFDNADIQNLRVLWPLFIQQYFDNARFALIARRFFYCGVRILWEDKLIDLMIVLEALLVPETSGSKGDKIANRLSVMMQHQFNAEETFAVVRKAYKLRNDLVHGDTVDMDNDAKSIIEQVTLVARLAIQEYLKSYIGLSSKELSDQLDGKPKQKKVRGTVNSWFNLGDQFAISHVSLFSVDQQFVSTPEVFLITQAIESYLKGCYLKRFPDKDPADFSHNLYKIFNKLKTDSAFLPDIVIPQDVYDAFTISHNDKKTITVRQKKIIDQHYYLLLSMKYGFELKYFGTGLKSIPEDSYSYGLKALDNSYAQFINGVRKYTIRNQDHNDPWLSLMQSSFYTEFSDDQKNFVLQVRKND